MNLRKNNSDSKYSDRQPSHGDESDQSKNDVLKCYFSMLDESEDGFWVDSSGLSMLPTFYHSVKVHIVTDIESLDIGDIVVFHRSNKFIAHRIVGYDSLNELYITKGDTLYFFDGPVKKDEFLGRVDFVQKKGRKIPILRNRKLAEISAKIGRPLTQSLAWLPAWLKFLYYFSCFIPSYIIYLFKNRYS